MTLAANTRLGPYEIVAVLGVGGMGEVYRARDTRLNRDVAIKILPAAVADHPSRRERFAREAQSISQLSHSHICAIYDVGRERLRPARGAESPRASEREPSADHAGGGAPAHEKRWGPASPDVDGAEVDFLVMEYIEGESLEKRLRLGPLPWATALEWAIQIADAVDVAHRRGIVHRDLKPANIMVADSGIKLLDFGLAKLLENTDASAGELTKSITTEQKVLGTLHYMSPEQLEGREVDARTDVFAFGVTLYEMVTGRKAFDGTSAASVSAAILTAEPPPVSSSAAGKSVVAPGLDHIIRRALAKHPDERWQTARDMMLEMRWLKDGRPRPATASVSSRRPRWLAIAAGATAVALLTGVGGWRLGLRQPRPVTLLPIVFTIAAPPNTVLGTGYNMMAVSPDGRKVVFVAGPEGGTRHLWLQSLDSPIAHALLGAEQGHAPFWSPDSKWIGFRSKGDKQLQRVSISGGTPVVITDLASPWVDTDTGAFWSSDDTIVFAQPGGLFRVKATGGEPPVPLSVDGGMPRALSGGRFLYLVNQKHGDGGLKIQGPGLAAPVPVPVQSNGVFVAGHMVFRQGPSLFAQPFDARALRLTGSPTTVAEDVSYNPSDGRTLFDVSEDVLAYRVEDPRTLTWRDRDGRFRGSIGEIGRDWNPAIAPDGSLRVGVERWDAPTNTFHLWTLDDQGRATQLTRGAHERGPTWSPDGKWLVYRYVNADVFELRRQSSDGKGETETLLQHSGRLTPLDYSRDGRFFVYLRGEAQPKADPSAASNDGFDLWTLPLVGDDKRPRRITETPAIVESSARLSPDGRWLAYSSDEGGQANIWVQEFRNGAPRRRISMNGGFDPSWSADGTELYFVARDGTLMAAPVTTGPAFSFRTPTALFRFDLGRTANSLHLYSATPDGQRFLVSETSRGPGTITVVVHWTSLLP